MISILGRLLPPPPLLMELPNACGGSQRLIALAQQLRLYKPPPFPSDDDIEEQRIEETAGKVVSQVGFAESDTPVARDPEKFRPKRAAVLICLFEGDAGDLRVILTKRSSGLSTHSGEVSLPGGKTEEGDKDDGDTATREAKEEIGLDPKLVNVVTVLEPFLSKHLLRVVPVIGILNEKEAFKPNPNPAEVEAVFDAPLEMFLKDENRTSKEREWMGDKFLIHFFDYETKNKKYMIWGLTAGILIRAASVVYKRPPNFVEQNPRFKVPRVVDRNTTIPKKALNKIMSSVEVRLQTLAQSFRLEQSVKSPPPPTGSATSASTSKRAAILVCLFKGDDGELRVILTKRSSSLSSNPGDVALPGGKRDEADADDVDTALREAKEEIGLDPSLVNVVTVLDHIVNKRGMTVVPVIGLLSDIKAFSPAPNAAEVEAIFDAPLEMFLKDEKRREEEREWMGDKYLLHYFDFEADDGKEYVIWALTAGVLIKAASTVYERPPAFLEQRPKFWVSGGASTTMP
ncbi:hypothetical protein ACFX2I_004908 [Malus domestica]